MFLSFFIMMALLDLIVPGWSDPATKGQSPSFVGAEEPIQLDYG